MKKILAMCLVVALMATAIAGATLAYFTDVTEKATNTFTVGNVDIELDEPNWDPEENGSNIMPGASFPKDPTITVVEGSEDCYVFLDVTLNKYKSLFPIIAMWASEQENIDVDYTDFVEDGVFKTSKFLGHYMNNDMATLRTILDSWFQGITHENWAIKDFYYDKGRDDVTVDGNWLTLRLAYIGNGDAVLSATDTVKFMDAFAMPADVTEAMIDNDLTANQFYEGGDFIIEFTAYAIQAQKLDDVDAAYTAYFDQN